MTPNQKLGLENLVSGYTKPGITLYYRYFNEMESPVPCSSDVKISADKINYIEKRKKPGKRPQKKTKYVWEFLQYEILHRLFEEYSLITDGKVGVPIPMAVIPDDYKMVTEFIPGFILATFNNHPETEGMTVVNDLFTPDGIPKGSVVVEYSIAYHLGMLARIKEIEGVYHSDFDARHVIFNPLTLGISMFDLENARYCPDLNYIKAESVKMILEWSQIAKGRGADPEELLIYYDLGREVIDDAKGSPELRPKRYGEIVKEVESEYDIIMSVTRGEINRKAVGLSPLDRNLLKLARFH
jgi:hypothetical protein